MLSFRQSIYRSISPHGATHAAASPVADTFYSARALLGEGRLDDSISTTPLCYLAAPISVIEIDD